MQRAKINVLFVTFASNRISRLHPPMWKEDRVSASHRLVDSHHKCISNTSCINNYKEKKSKAISFGLQSLFSSIPELARICAEKKKRITDQRNFLQFFKFSRKYILLKFPKNMQDGVLFILGFLCTYCSVWFSFDFRTVF